MDEERRMDKGQIVPTVEIHRHLLSFRDWQILGKRYMDELTPEELKHWRRLHQGEPGVPTDSDE